MNSTSRDGRLFACGSCDMKDSMRRRQCEQAGRVVRWSSTGIGAGYATRSSKPGCSLAGRAVAVRTVLPRSTIIGEPTMLEVVRMHKGHLKFTIRLSAPGHSTPALASTPSRSRPSHQRHWGADRRSMRSVPSRVPCLIGPSSGAVHRRGRRRCGLNIIPESCQIRCGLRVMPIRMRPSTCGSSRSPRLPCPRGTGPSRSTTTTRRCALTGDDGQQVACEAAGQSRCIGVSYCSDGGICPARA